MDLSHYRREYSDYHAALEGERYRYHAGFSTGLRLEPIRERYSDLWTREAVEDLSQKLDDTPEHFETERIGIRSLLAAARLEYVESFAHEVKAELARCESAAHITWDGEGVRASDVRTLVAREADAVRRRELAARLADSLRVCEDLRAARLDALGGAAQSLGFPSQHALQERLSVADSESLAARADDFLERTAPFYLPSLAGWASREAAAAPHALYGADEPFFERATWLDAFIRPGDERTALRETLRDLGIHRGGRRGVVIDDEERPLKKHGAACFGVRPPEEVYLVAGGAPTGALSYLEFFFEAGRAQHFAWCSAETAARHPEFIRAPDDAVRAGAGYLFRGFFLDAGWIGERLGLRATDASALARGVALLELWDVRRCCAGLHWALALDAASDKRAEQLAENYVSLYAEATGFRPDPALRLAAADAAYGAAVRLRARLLAESLREHLRGRYGRRWYMSRGAGDELIDMWNSGLRYTAEALARLAWGGALDFDLLAETLRTALDGE